MNVKEVKPAKNCSVCKNFKVFRGSGGACGLDNTQINKPDAMVCTDKPGFEPRIIR